MHKLRWLCCTVLLLTSMVVVAQTPSPLTRNQVRHRFEPVQGPSGGLAPSAVVQNTVEQ